MLPQELTGKYEARGTLGSGAMGTVLEAFDRMIERTVAVKLVKLPGAGDEEAEEAHARFRREAQAAGRLSHPHIVGVFDYGENRDTAWIVMEMVNGGSLKNILDRKERLPVPEIARLMGQVLEALDYSHQRGVVHRDIKPANIMLTADGQVKIADFGIARIESSTMTQVGTVMGTPSYMAPEQLRGEPVDARADIWASGVMLYQLLTGEKPFDGGFTALLHRVINTEPPPPSQLAVSSPRSLDAVVAKALAKRPDDRYRSAAEFAEAIRHAVANPTVAPPPADDLDRRVDPFDVSNESTMVAGAARPAAPPAAAARPAAPPATAAATSPPPAKKGGALPLILGGGAAAVIAAGAAGFFLLGGGSGGEQPLPTPTPIASNVTPPAGPGTGPAGGPTSGPTSGPTTPTPTPTPTPTVAPVPTPSPPTPTPTQPSVLTPAPVAPPTTAPAPPTTSAPPTLPVAPSLPTVPAIPTTGTQPTPGLPTPTTPVVPPTQGPVQAPPVATPPIATPPIIAPTQPTQVPVTPPPVTPTQPTPPNQTQAVLSIPSVADIRAAAQAAAASAPCALLETQPQEGGAVIAGILRRGGDAVIRRTLQERNLPQGSVGLRLRPFDGPFCSALEAVRPIAAASSEAPQVSILGVQPLQKGDLLRFDVLMPDRPSQLYVSYLMKSAEVAHLVPSQTTAAGARIRQGEPRGSFPGWEVDEPYGIDMILVFASDRPLFSAPRPQLEKLDDYLVALNAAIRRLRDQGARISARAILVETVERR